MNDSVDCLRMRFASSALHMQGAPASAPRNVTRGLTRCLACRFRRTALRRGCRRRTPTALTPAPGLSCRAVGRTSRAHPPPLPPPRCRPEAHPISRSTPVHSANAPADHAAWPWGRLLRHRQTASAAHGELRKPSAPSGQSRFTIEISRSLALHGGRRLKTVRDAPVPPMGRGHCSVPSSGVDGPLMQDSTNGAPP